MPGTHRQSLLLWAILPSSLVTVACASSGSGLTPGGDPLGGQSGAGANSSVPTSGSGVTNGGSSNGGGSNSSSGGSAQTNGGSSSVGSSNGGSSDGGSSLGGSSNGGLTSTATNEGGTATVYGGALNGGGKTSTKGGAGGAKSGGAAGRTAAAGAQAGNIGAGSTCANGEKDGDESDVDCGGSCAPTARCDIGQTCAVARDCTTTSCMAKACSAPILIVKNAGCVSAGAACPSAASSLQAKIQVLNVGKDALALKGLEIRYYFTDEVAATPVIEIYDKSLSTFDLSIVAMPTAAPQADHYVKAVYSAGSLIPDVNRICDRGDNSDCADFTFAIHTANYQGSYDPSNDYSFVPSPSLINNGNITVHLNGAIIWGTPP